MRFVAIIVLASLGLGTLAGCGGPTRPGVAPTTNVNPETGSRGGSGAGSSK